MCDTASEKTTAYYPAIYRISVLKVKEASGNLAQDTFTIVKSLCSHLPSDARLVELHLAAAGLARVLGNEDWKDDLRRAETLAGEKYRGKIRKIGHVIDDFSLPPLKAMSFKTRF